MVKPQIYRNANGEIVYEGLPWAQLSDDERTARIKECQEIQHCSRLQLAIILKALTADRKPSQAQIAGHMERHKIVHPRITRSNPPGFIKLKSVTDTCFGRPTLGHKEYKKQRRKFKAQGEAIIAKVEQTAPEPITEMEKLKNQTGFCIAVDTRTKEYCGEPAEGKLCEKHKKARSIR